MQSDWLRRYIHCVARSQPFVFKKKNGNIRNDNKSSPQKFSLFFNSEIIRKQLFASGSVNINLLLTEREGRTGEYWPEVVTVRTERSEVRTKTTEGQYSPVRPEQARLVSSLLYGTLFLIVKCTSGGLHLKNVRLLHPSLKFPKKFNLFSFCW